MQQDTSATHHLRKYPLLHSRTDLTLDVSNLPITKVESLAKEIITTTRERQDNDPKLVPPNTLMLNKHHSHSSGEVTERQQKISIELGSSISMALGQETTDKNQLANPNICASRSENSLKTIGDTLTQAMTNPSATAKDMVLSPFSKLAKGIYLSA